MKNLLRFALAAVVLSLAACAITQNPALIDYQSLNVAERPHAQVERLTTINTAWGRVRDDYFHVGGDPDKQLIVPMPSFLIERKGSYTLVDTGVPPTLAVDPALYLGRFKAWLMRGYIEKRMILHEGWDVPTRLKQLGIEGHRVEHVILTHGHFDHTGANRAFLHATFHMTKETYDLGRAGSNFSGYFAQDFPDDMKTHLVDFTGSQPFLTFTGSHDLFGDGSVIVVPLPGHAPGHVGVFVETKHGSVLLAGDSAYTMRNIEKPTLLGHLNDEEAAWDSLCRLNRLMKADPDIRIVPSHDPEVFRILPTFPEGL